MTRNESFKRRIRARMAKTGERYNAARRALIEQANGRDERGWMSQPEHTDEIIRANTGRGAVGRVLVEQRDVPATSMTRGRWPRENAARAQAAVIRPTDRQALRGAVDRQIGDRDEPGQP